GEAVELVDVVDAVRAALPEAERERVHAEIDGEPIVRGDPELLRAMIHNAIDNALKFSRERVDVRIHGDERVVIDVIDRGPGIPASERDAVFAAFYRRADTRGTPGHGIGLALIAHVAAAHDGHAELVDAKLGAHLQITLPRWAE
ncbi:MAG TPA: ATP-binding protein, partial [Nannocystaceae bacterium]|nr:ATP-binding protein [Nannocystaceae bacterium]